jgi:hypothetical protein
MSAQVSEPKPSTYSSAHKKYYLEHKAEILQRSRETGAYERKYKSAYERNKDAIKAKALARYYAKKALVTPPHPPAEIASA